MAMIGNRKLTRGDKASYSLADLMRGAGVNNYDAHRYGRKIGAPLGMLADLAMGPVDAVKGFVDNEMAYMQKHRRARPLLQTLPDALNLAANATDLAPAMSLAAIAGKPLLKEAAQRVQRGAMELDYFGQPVRLLMNPTPVQTTGFLNRTKYKAARRVTNPETGDVYIWDANDPALHAMIAEKLGFKYDQSLGDMIGLD